MKYKELLKLVAENPDLPIVPMVDYEIVGEDYGRWLGSFGNAYVGEYALYNDRYYEEREEFKERYVDYHCDELKLNNSEELEKYLDEIADEYFIKAIIVNIDLPDC